MSPPGVPLKFGAGTKWIMSVAAISSLDLSGSSDEQAVQVRDAIRIVFPEAVTLVREAREGLQD